MDNSINFRGAFLVKQPTPKLKQGIKSVIKDKPQQIFKNFAGKGDELYVVENSIDKEVAEFLRTISNIKFKYYPTLNTKSGLNVRKPEEAVNILRAADVQEKNLELMCEETKVDFKDPKFKKNIDVKTGVCTVKTNYIDHKTGKRREHTLLTITPPGKFGTCYAKYEPVPSEEMTVQNDTTRRIAIKNGTKVLEYVTSDSERYMDYLSGENNNQKAVDKRFNQYVKEAKDYYKSQQAKKSGEGIIA